MTDIALNIGAKVANICRRTDRLPLYISKKGGTNWETQCRSSIGCWTNDLNLKTNRGGGVVEVKVRDLWRYIMEDSFN